MRRRKQVSCRHTHTTLMTGNFSRDEALSLTHPHSPHRPLTPRTSAGRHACFTSIFAQLTYADCYGTSLICSRSSHYIACVILILTSPAPLMSHTRISPRVHAQPLDWVVHLATLAGCAVRGSILSCAVRFVRPQTGQVCANAKAGRPTAHNRHILTYL